MTRLTQGQQVLQGIVLQQDLQNWNDRHVLHFGCAIEAASTALFSWGQYSGMNKFQTSDSL